MQTDATHAATFVVDGRASYRTTGLAEGAHTFTARYMGNATMPGSTSAVVVVNVNGAVPKERTQMRLSVRRGRWYVATLEVSVSGAGSMPAGTVDIYVDGQRVAAGRVLEATSGTTAKTLLTGIREGLDRVVYGGSATHQGLSAEMVVR